MNVIDHLALQYNATKNKEYFTMFVKHATPIIRKTIFKACRGSYWDTDELFSILLVDMWRLFNRWRPVKEKQFHWLMLRQLRNKTINYIHSQIGQSHKICPVCGKHQLHQFQQPLLSYCYACKSSLKISNIVITEAFDNVHAHTPDCLTQIANTQLVERLFKEVQNDPKTCKMLKMLLEGESKTTISKEVGIAQNALNNRLRKCKSIICRLLKENT
jgi:DNA-directed RNA polymerase specialized sigma24 family protein